MQGKRKRQLLAHIEGQLAALDDADRSLAARRWQRVARAIRILQAMPLDTAEQAYRRNLEAQVTTMMDRRQSRSLLLHRRTLARADCVIWQMYLKRRVPLVPVPPSP